MTSDDGARTASSPSGEGDVWQTAASYERLQAIFRLAPTGIGIVDLDGHTVLTNDALREMLGYSQEEFSTLHWSAFTHPDDVQRNLELFEDMVAGRSERFEMDKRFFHKRGGIIWGRLTVSLLRDEDGGPSLAIGMLENVTEQRRLQQQLTEAEATYRLLVEQVPAVVYVADVDDDGRWMYVSSQIQSLLGFSPDVWVGDCGMWSRQVHPEDHDTTVAAFTEATAHDDEQPRVLHYRMHRADGTMIWVRDEFRILRDTDGRRVFRGVLVDATREKELEARLERQAFHDPLTKLANRDLFTDRVTQCLRHAARQSNRHDAVIFVDLDDFKTVNDSLGHAAGDELICSVAERLRTCLRPSDTAGRLGGDEFAVLVEDVENPEDVLLIADRVQKAVQRPHRLSNKTIATSASLGVAYLEDADTTDIVLRNADLAMYRAKERGKGRVATYESAMHAAAVRRLDIRSALEGAVGRGEMSVHLQPIVGLADGRMTGAEALLRWQHPEFGIVSPEDFIPVAEETGTISRTGAWVLDQSCRWLAARHADGWTDLSVAVNVSPHQLRSETFVSDVTERLTATGIAPPRLTLELTEQALMGERSWRTLRELRELGVRIAMDDFGMGYASLARLGELAIDVLKIDRQFVRRMDGSARSVAVPQAITSLARSLDLTVIAEGVETPAQRDALLSMGCAAGQGYLFGDPVPLDDAPAFLGRPLADRASWPEPMART